MHFKYKDTDRLRGKGWGKDIPTLSYANREHMEAAVAVLISDKLDFKIRNIIRDKEGYFTVIKRINSLERHKYPKCVCIY